jgi:hypothetical protein
MAFVSSHLASFSIEQHQSATALDCSTTTNSNTTSTSLPAAHQASSNHKYHATAPSSATDLSHAASSAPSSSTSTASMSVTRSVSDSQEPECRICRTGSDENAHLISPCACKGSIQYVHPQCIVKWITYTDRARDSPSQNKRFVAISALVIRYTIDTCYSTTTAAAVTDVIDVSCVVWHICLCGQHGLGDVGDFHN